MTGNPTRYWLPAKRFGWGWGPPATWQGWVVLAAGGVAQVAIAVRFVPAEPVRFAVGTLALVVALIAICYVKGEPPAARRSDRDE